MKSIQHLQETRGSFSIGQAIGDGWNLISKYLLYYILAGVLVFIIVIGIGFIPVLGSLATNLVVWPCFIASAIFLTWQISKGYGWANFGDIFRGYNYATPIIVSTLIQFAITTALTLLCFFSFLPELMQIIELYQEGGPFENRDEINQVVQSMFVNGKTFLLFGLFMIVMLFISVIWAFKYHFIVVYNMQAWPAMELSRKVCTPNMLPLIGLFIVLGLIIIVSAVPCGIGLLFSLPLSIGALYSAFAQITGSDQPDEVNNEMFDFVNDENNKNK